jgi:hypothetical protein
MKVSKGCKKHRIILAGANFSSSLANSSRDGPAWDGRLAYTVNETIRLLSISRGTLYKLKRLKLLTTVKLCGRRVVTRASILGLLEGRDE